MHYTSKTQYIVQRWSESLSSPVATVCFVQLSYYNAWEWNRTLRGGNAAQLVRASNHHAADAGSIPRCGKGFFSQSQLSVQTLLRCPYTPVCNRMLLHLCARKRSCSPCQSSVGYGNTNTPSMHRKLGSATLSQLAFPGKSNPNFSWEKSYWDNTVEKKFCFVWKKVSGRVQCVCERES